MGKKWEFCVNHVKHFEVWGRVPIGRPKKIYVLRNYLWRGERTTITVKKKCIPWSSRWCEWNVDTFARNPCFTVSSPQSLQELKMYIQAIYTTVCLWSSQANEKKGQGKDPSMKGFLRGTLFVFTFSPHKYKLLIATLEFSLVF